MNESNFVHLFSYGTLQDEAVQVSTFGRKLKGVPDKLVGYRQTKVPIKDQPSVTGYYLNVEPSEQENDVVTGTRFEVTEPELLQADEYEATADYQRITVNLSSGTIAWVYVSAARCNSLPLEPTPTLGDDNDADS